jgi:N-acetylglutamate synthase-like GNAT family acetyltransferase
MNGILRLEGPRHPLKETITRKLELWHLENMRTQEGIQQFHFLEKWNYEHTGFTLFEPSGMIIFCAGCYSCIQGVGDVWFVPGPAIDDYKRETYVHTLLFLEHTAKALKLRRIQAVLKEGAAKELRFVERLGFDCEGTMRSLFPSCDGLMYARIF